MTGTRKTKMHRFDWPYTTGEVARLLQVCAKTVVSLADRGDLAFYCVGADRRFTRAALARLIAGTHGLLAAMEESGKVPDGFDPAEIVALIAKVREIAATLPPVPTPTPIALECPKCGVAYPRPGHRRCYSCKPATQAKAYQQQVEPTPEERAEIERRIEIIRCKKKLVAETGNARPDHSATGLRARKTVHHFDIPESFPENGDSFAR